MLEELDDTIGLDRLRALHVNDARDPLGSNRDRHANIGEGTIGSKLGVFLSHPKLQGLPAFLEVPGTDDHGPDAKQLRRSEASTSAGAKHRLAPLTAVRSRPAEPASANGSPRWPRSVGRPVLLAL